MAKDNEYGALRVKTDTVEFLKDLKAAYELSYGSKFTMDEFLRQMAASVEDGDPAVWEIHCKMQTQKDELKRIAEETKPTLREKKN